MNTIFILIFIVMIVALIGSFKNRSFLIILIPPLLGLIIGSIKSQQIQSAENLSGYHTMSSGFTFVGLTFSGFFIGILAFAIYKLFASNLNENIKFIIVFPLFLVVAFLLCMLRVFIA